MLKIGDHVEVLDPGLAQLRAIMVQFGDDPGPNNRGWVEEIWNDTNEVLIRFPIGDDDPDKHAQIAPYPVNQVRKL